MFTDKIAARVLNAAEKNVHRITDANKRLQAEAIFTAYHTGALSPMTAIWMLISIGVSLVLGILLMGKFTDVAQGANFGLTEMWNTTLTGVIDTLGSSMSLAGILPFALIGAAAMGIIAYAFGGR